MKSRSGVQCVLFYQRASAIKGNIKVTDADIWSEWILHNRTAGDAEYAKRVRADVAAYEDKVLAGAKLEAGNVLLDVGAGEGLLALRAIEQVGSSLQVILSDISKPLLAHAENLAQERGVREQCRFVQCSAEAMPEIADGSVDVITTRSVLAYVADKPQAFREFYRILKPGGRISIAEPLFRDRAMVMHTLRKRVEALETASQISPADTFARLLYRWNTPQLPDTMEEIAQNPLTNYSERDFIGFTQQAGFNKIHMEFHMDIVPSMVPSWDVYLDTAPHPLSPTLRHLFETNFNAQERAILETVLRPGIDEGTSTSTNTMIYLTAIKPLK